MSQLPATLEEYNIQVTDTDLLPQYDLHPVLFGLYGEVGSILTTAKKHYREKDILIDYKNAVEEELGDVLWYFAALCRRLNVSIESLFASSVDSQDYTLSIAAASLVHGPIAQTAVSSLLPHLDPTLPHLAPS